MKEKEEHDPDLKEPSGDVDDLIFCMESDWTTSDR